MDNCCIFISSDCS